MFLSTLRTTLTARRRSARRTSRPSVQRRVFKLFGTTGPLSWLSAYLFVSLTPIHTVVAGAPFGAVLCACRYVVLPKDFDKGYKKNVRKADTEHEFYVA